MRDLHANHCGDSVVVMKGNEGIRDCAELIVVIWKVIDVMEILTVVMVMVLIEVITMVTV